ncbi:MAG: hypothetical protein HY613_00370 [Candidatus Rokubacteria bacterium]|nr:hypothetical protein [Candidatus Rokubacteria bacterium]
MPRRKRPVPRAIKEQDPGVPVFMVTGWGTEYSPEQLKACGVDRVLPKPLKVDDMLAAVAAVRPRSGSQEDSP